MTYRRYNEELAAHQVEDSDRAGAVSIRQQGTFMTPCNLTPVRVRVLGHCRRADNRQIRINISALYFKA